MGQPEGVGAVVGLLEAAVGLHLGRFDQLGGVAAGLQAIDQPVPVEGALDGEAFGQAAVVGSKAASTVGRSLGRRFSKSRSSRSSRSLSRQ